jgi:hypothetical protein
LHTPKPDSPTSAPSRIAKPEKRALIACTIGKLLCSAGHLAVCASPR